MISLNNDQLKLFIDGVFFKHSSSNSDILSIGELYQFFCNFFSGTNITLNDVQKTLVIVKTESSEKITKKEMYGILKILVNKRKEREVMKERINRNSESFEYQAKKEKSKPQKEQKENKGDGAVIGGKGGQNQNVNVNQNQNVKQEGKQEVKKIASPPSTVKQVAASLR